MGNVNDEIKDNLVRFAEVHAGERSIDQFQTEGHMKFGLFPRKSKRWFPKKNSRGAVTALASERHFLPRSFL